MTTQTPFSWAATALGLCLALTACDPESSPASLDGGASSDEQASSGDAPEPVPCGEGDDPSSCDDCRALPDDACSEADPAAPACDRGTGLCMECGISAPGQCGDGLTCIDGACVDRCEDLGGTWAGLLTTTTSEPDHESIESQRELHLELEQVEGEGSAAYCPFGPWTQSMGAEPDAWIGLQGRIDTEEVRGAAGRDADGMWWVCLERGEGHGVTFFEGTLGAGCSLFEGETSGLYQGGDFIVVRSSGPVAPQ